MLVGSFGPWAKAFFVSVSGTDGSNDGWLVVVAAIVGGIGLIRRAATTGRGAALLATTAGIAGTVVTIHDRNQVTNVGSGSLVQIGWGLNLALLASVALAVVGAVLLFSKSQQTPTQYSSPAAPPPPEGGAVAGPPEPPE